MKHGKLMIWVLSACVLACPWTPGWAEEGQSAPLNPEPVSGSVFDLGEVVVKEKGETITEVATVDTVDQERIELTNSNDVSEAINTLPGVFLSVGTKNEKNFTVRGFDQRYVPLFFDGVPIYIPNDGYVDTGKLPTSNISKITLTKGVASVLYGANTMGGAMNIVTRKPQKTFEGDIEMSYEDVDHKRFDTNLGTRLGDFYMTFNGEYVNSEGFRLSNDFSAQRNQGKGTRENSDVEQRSGAFKVGFNPADGHDYALAVNTVDSEWGFPPNTYASSPRQLKYWRFTDWKMTNYYFIGDSKITDNFWSKIRLYQNEYDNTLDSYDDESYTTQNKRYAFHSTYDDQSTGGSITLRSDYIPRNLLSFSFHYKEDTHKEQDDVGEAWEKYRMETFSYGLEDDIRITDRLSIVAGVSYDEQKPKDAGDFPIRDNDTAFNPQGGILFRAFQDTNLHFSVGRKTRFPTLLELYSGLLGKNIPNPDLESEQSVNYELGVSQPLPGDTTVGLNLFYSDIKDLIVNRRLPDGDQYQNIGKARYQGVEFNFRSNFLKNNLFELNYTYLDAENRTPDRTSDYLPERPKHKLYVSDLFEVNRWVSLYASVLYNSKRWEEDFDVPDQWNSVDGFWTVDFKVIGTLAEYLTVEAGAKNLFDENYEYSEGYPRPGRTFFAVLRGSF